MNMAELDLENIKWPDVSYDKWQEKLKKELKTDDLSAFNLEIEKDLNHEPFKERSKSEKSFQIEKFPNTGYGQFVDIQNESEANKAILFLLQNDLRTLKLKANSNTNWEILLKDIYPELLSIDLLCENEDALKHFNDYRKSQPTASEWKISTQLISQSNSILSIDYSHYHGLSQIEMIRCVLADLKVHDQKAFNLSFPIKENLLEVIPFFRSLRLAFEKHFINKEIYINAVANLDRMTDDLNDQIIRAGSIYVFATMSGVDNLFLRTLKDSGDLNHHRLLLNIQNILELESKTGDKKDPLFGSYVVENLTAQLLSAVS